MIEKEDLIIDGPELRRNCVSINTLFSFFENALADIIAFLMGQKH